MTKTTPPRGTKRTIKETSTQAEVRTSKETPTKGEPQAGKETPTQAAVRASKGTSTETAETRTGKPAPSKGETRTRTSAARTPGRAETRAPESAVSAPASRSKRQAAERHSGATGTAPAAKPKAPRVTEPLSDVRHPALSEEPPAVAGASELPETMVSAGSVEAMNATAPAAGPGTTVATDLSSGPLAEQPGETVTAVAGEIEALPAETKGEVEPAEKPEPKPVAVGELSRLVEPQTARYPEIEPEPPMMEPEPDFVTGPGTEPDVHSPVSAQPSLFIVHITPELAPVAKVGGLADVVFGLSNELEIRGSHVEIILPKYDCLRYDHIWGLSETFGDLWVPWYGGAIHCTVYFGFVHGRKCFFIEPHSSDNFFNRGCIYGFNDDVFRFAFFTRAAMEFLWKSGKNPEIIHCHDWQTALAPVFLFEIYKFLGMNHPRVCFTIHNFKHQGVTGAQLLQATGLNRPEYYFHYDRLQDNFNPHALNLMKGGVVYSNFVTTVSPRYASEAKDEGQGFGLEPTLHIHHMKYGGVVNGIDYNMWNPEVDRYIPYHYGGDDIDEKYKNKRALRDRLMLADNEKPIVAFVGRLDPQKGLELIRHAIFYTLHRRGQFVLLGSSPDGQINNYFWGLKHQLNENPDVHIEIGFNEELSHLIYAGADLMLVPSRFEPCGLTQLIALRYGTVPVVREVGGLADTIFDKDYSYKPLHERNGYVFRDYDYSGLESALGRALSCFFDYPEDFRDLMKNTMHCDFSWKNPGQDYLNIYDLIREK